MMLAMDTYSSTEICRHTGLPYRILDYWVRCGVISPARPARGSGSRREWTAEQFHHLTVMAEVHRYLANYTGDGHISTDTMRSLATALDEGRVWLVGVRVDEDGALELSRDGFINSPGDRFIDSPGHML